ncbi:MAG: deoxyribose-phosphate aldolase [Phycisphaerae bacterium]|jgi:deoxyribose-phosphate aldolase
MTRRELASKIDHSLLKAEATPAMIDTLCEEALAHGFYGVCVNPLWVSRCRDRLAGSAVAVVAVAGFPLGAALPAIKLEEARRALQDGALEIDMVISVGDLIAGRTDRVRDEIAAVADLVHAASPRHALKVILETAALTEAQIIAGCRCVAEGQADFVKTSTGFHPAGGASVSAVRLLHKHGSPIRVKAAGGIRDLATAQAMLEAGADRLGCSASVAILAQIAE